MILKWAAYAFFYGYVGLLVVAGLWGLVLADIDLDLFIKLDVDTLQDQTKTNLLSQYRFLRAMEFGLGIFAFWYRGEIFVNPTINRIFLVIMGTGIAARALSLLLDGIPGALFNFFLISELIGLILIYIYTRRTLVPSS